MTFAELIEAQWSDYADRHRNRTNLLIHIVAVPVFWLGALQALGGALLLLLGVPGAFGMLFWAVVFMGGALFAQAHGNSMEGRPPPRMGDSKEYVRRVVAEQFINFPRFVVSGSWYRNFQQPG